MIAQPYGIIYVTGPTGSGKTTTLYSALAELNDPNVNISTAEDPIEYDLPRINQVQAHKDIGLDFARILRAFLRQDPDIILVGETRDKETAHIAVEAALDRSPGFHHPAHQRRRGRLHPPGRDGHRALPDVQLHHRHRRPAPDAPPLSELQGGLHAG